MASHSYARDGRHLLPLSSHRTAEIPHAQSYTLLLLPRASVSLTCYSHGGNNIMSMLAANHVLI